MIEIDMLESPVGPPDKKPVLNKNKSGDQSYYRNRKCAIVLRFLQVQICFKAAYTPTVC